MLSRLLKNLRNRIVLTSARNLSRRSLAMRRCMQLEPLETRILPAAFTVTNLNDSGPGSLRKAILDANNQAGADTIQFQSGLTGTITLMTGELLATESVSIFGPGADKLAISGNNSHRIFRFECDGPNSFFVMNLTLKNGNAGISSGGAIQCFNDSESENLFQFHNLTFQNNTASKGGAIAIEQPNTTVAIVYCTFSGNSATETGGAIYRTLGPTATFSNAKPTFISLSSFSSNRASNGGAIYDETQGEGSTLAQLFLIQSTIAGNSATDDGGGLWSNHFVHVQGSTFSSNNARSGGAFYNSMGIATFRNSTISGNSALDFGGGLWNLDGGSLTLDHTTVVLNRANADGNMIGAGGGVSQWRASIAATNSIIAGNVRGAVGADVPDDATQDPGSPSFTFLTDVSTNNLIGHPASAGGLTHGNMGNILGNGHGSLLPLSQMINPALAANGGPTLNHALTMGSPAIDNGRLLTSVLIKPTAVVSSTNNTDHYNASGLLDATHLTLQNYRQTKDGSQIWVTADRNGPTGSDYFANDLSGPVLTFSLDRVYLLGSVAMWGYSSSRNNDPKLIRLEFSTDGGQNYGNSITVHKPRYASNEIVSVLPFFAMIPANSVRMTFVDNWFGEPGDIGGDRVGLEEVRFLQEDRQLLNWTTDQRGGNFSRNRDGDHKGEILPDIGAFESQGIRVSSPNPNAFSIRPTITWNAIAGATSYFVHIENESTGDRNFHLATSNTNLYTPASDLAIGRLKIWIRPNFGNTPGNWSIPHWINVFAPATWTPMERVQLTSRPTLTWNAQPGAATYDIWIDNFSTGQKQIIRQDVPGTSFTPSMDLPIGIYRVWVRGKAADGALGGWSGTYEMLIVPGAEPVGPLSGTFDRTPTFSWRPVAGSAGYEFYLRNLSTGAMVFDKQPVAGTNFTPAISLTDGLYRWHTFAIGSGPASGLKSGGATTTVIFVGGRPTLTSPATGSSSSDRTPTFTWQLINGATSYRLFVSRTDVAQSGVINQVNLIGASYTQPTNLAAGTYRAWIQAVSSTGELSPWSLDLTFTLT